MTNSTVYSTATGEKTPEFEELSLELRYELGLPTEESSRDYDPFYDESDYYDEWCFVCSRPTDHRGEHDDLVAEGRAKYDSRLGMVYSA
jgi:hypothetical protein